VGPVQADALMLPIPMKVGNIASPSALLTPSNPCSRIARDFVTAQTQTTLSGCASRAVPGSG
jgi:hypothetical protein